MIFDKSVCACVAHAGAMHGVLARFFGWVRFAFNYTDTKERVNKPAQRVR